MWPESMPIFIVFRVIVCDGIYGKLNMFFFQAEDGIRDFCLSRGLGMHACVDGRMLRDPVLTLCHTASE